MANLIIGGVLLALMVLALRHTVKKTKEGGCPGGCDGCSHCSAMQQDNKADDQKAS